MIHRERVADDVYTFQSDVYAQVNAGAVIGQDWAVVIDTLAFPDETLAIREFIDLYEWQCNEIQAALLEADAGDFASDEEIENVFSKWMGNEDLLAAQSTAQS